MPARRSGINPRPTTRPSSRSATLDGARGQRCDLRSPVRTGQPSRAAPAVVGRGCGVVLSLSFGCGECSRCRQRKRRHVATFGDVDPAFSVQRSAMPPARSHSRSEGCKPIAVQRMQVHAQPQIRDCNSLEHGRLPTKCATCHSYRKPMRRREPCQNETSRRARTGRLVRRAPTRWAATGRIRARSGSAALRPSSIRPAARRCRPTAFSARPACRAWPCPP